MLLDFATVLTLAATCAPGVAPPTLLAIARVESGLDPLAIGVNGPSTRRPRPSTAAEAVAAAEALMAAGRDIDLGLAQINVRNLPRLGLTVRDAFDPCRNLAASARILGEGYDRAAVAAGPGQAALRTAISYYNTGSPERGFRNGYVARVTRAAQAPAETAPALRSRAPEPPAWDVFGRARLIRADLVLTSLPGAQP